MEHERIVYILEYLRCNTDEKHEVTIKDIRSALDGSTNLRGATALTIRRDLDRLGIMGYDIRTRSGAHNTTYFRLLGKKFTFNEIRFLVDSISINKFLSAQQKQDLIKKFEGMCSEAEVRQLISRISLNGRGAPTLDLLENLEKIHEIISGSQKIDFEYGKFDERKIMVYYSKKRDIIPVKVIYFEDYFYLKCMNTETSQIRTYRVDRMKNITGGEKTTLKPELPKYDGIVLDMFEPDYYESVKLRVKRFLWNDMLEQFGDWASAYNDDDNAYVIVKVKIGINDSFYRWVMKYGSNIEILAPQKVREIFRQKISEVFEIYRK